MVASRLDLHGIRHERAEILVERFFYSEEPPFEVITGNSITMQNMVLNMCRRFEYDCFHKHPNNMGALTVIEGL